MKRIPLLVYSLFGMAFGRPSGFCTANTQAEDIAALKEQSELQAEQLRSQAAEIDRLRAEAQLPREEAPVFSATAAMAKGAGVPMSDVNWRIQAGLEPAQAVEAAVAQLAADKFAEKQHEAAVKEEASK